MIGTDIIEMARNTTLKQLKIRDDRIVVLQYLNLAILELYKKFKLREEKAVITMVDGITEYLLDGVDANVSIDLTDNNILKVTHAVDVDDKELSIDEEQDDEGIELPMFNKVVVKTETLSAGDTITLTYRAAPNFLAAEGEEIPLPQQFLTPLLEYIGYCGQRSVNDSPQSETDTYFKRFNESCALIDLEGLGDLSELGSNNLTARGFV